MASNSFTGAVDTALTTLDANWVACTVAGHDGVTDLKLDGTGKLRTAARKISDAVRTDGDQTSKSRITIAAGDYAAGTYTALVACRRTTTTLGYDAEPASSTGLSTNINQVKVRRNGVLMETLSITPINSVTTALDLQIGVVNTVDVQVVINGQTVTSSGSGANDHSGAAVLTGGHAGLSIVSVGQLFGASAVAFLVSGSVTNAAGGGSLTDGGSASITGTGFGTASGTQEWLGGIGNLIESAANGSNFTSLGYPGWSTVGNGATTNVSTVRAYTRTKSLVNAWTASNFGFGLGRDFTSFTSLYTNSIFYINSAGSTNGQRKIFRWGGGADDGLLVSDSHNPNAYITQYNGGAGSYCVSSESGTTYLDQGSGGPLTILDGWFRLETLFIPDTSAGAGNGSFQFRTTRLSNNTLTATFTIPSKMFWGVGDAAMRWLVVQCYIGNEAQVAGASIHIDPDFYCIKNCGATPRFLLLGNASTLAACTVFSLCPYTAWSNTSISFTVNKGALSSLTSVYAYPYAGIGAPISTTGYVPS